MALVCVIVGSGSCLSYGITIHFRVFFKGFFISWFCFTVTRKVFPIIIPFFTKKQAYKQLGQEPQHIRNITYCKGAKK